jgi:hypothetical protein
MNWLWKENSDLDQVECDDSRVRIEWTRSRRFRSGRVVVVAAEREKRGAGTWHVGRQRSYSVR